MDFVNNVTVAHKEHFEQVLSWLRPWEVFSIPQFGQDLIVAVKWQEEVRFFNLWQVTMVDVVDPNDGREFRVETRLTGVGNPQTVSLNPWVTRPALLLAEHWRDQQSIRSPEPVAGG